MKNKFIVIPVLVYIIFFSFYEIGRQGHWWGMSDSTRAIQQTPLLPHHLGNFKRVEFDCVFEDFFEIGGMPRCFGTYDAGNTPKKEALEKTLTILERENNIYRTHPNAKYALAPTSDHAVAIYAKNYNTHDPLNEAHQAEIYVEKNTETGTTEITIIAGFCWPPTYGYAPYYEELDEYGTFGYDPIKNQYYNPLNGRYFIEDPQTEEFIYTDTHTKLH